MRSRLSAPPNVSKCLCAPEHTHTCARLKTAYGNSFNRAPARCRYTLTPFLAPILRAQVSLNVQYLLQIPCLTAREDRRGNACSECRPYRKQSISCILVCPSVGVGNLVV
ncbi:hypothetical protein XENTR_v10007882 [Xenopus tropicalis]|nr:hypothetical protein XENTR_v10007882 [Xenopus tropicalis]